MPSPTKVRRQACDNEACDAAWSIYRNAPLREVESLTLVADIDDTRPYGSVEHVDWEQVLRAKVYISHLTLSQHHVSTAGLIRFAMGRKKKDVQVVRYDGRLYLHNGHHRVMHAVMTGKVAVWARIADVVEPAAPHRWSADR